MMKILVMVFLLGSLAGSLGGCIALRADAPPPDTYRLQPLPPAIETPPQTASGSAPVTLGIAVPHVPPGLETDRIVLHLDGGRRLDYYAGAVWPDYLNEMLRETLVRSAQNYYPGHILVAPERRLPVSYRLVVTVDEFQPVYQNEAEGMQNVPELHAALRFTLLRLPGETIVTDFTFNERQRAAGNSLSQITGGLEALLHAILPGAFAMMEPHLVPVDRAR